MGVHPRSAQPQPGGFGRTALTAVGVAVVLSAASVASALPATAAPLTAALAYSTPDWEQPFGCKQVWEGSTRSSHSPSAYSVDFNRYDDINDPVVATAPGVVTRVENLGGRSYGLYIIVDHGGGYTSLYAHLNDEFVTVGQRVDQGQLLALVGSSGGSTGPHLHFEERLNGRVQRPEFTGQVYNQPQSLASKNCGATPIAADLDGDQRSTLGFFKRKLTPKFKIRKTKKVNVVAQGHDDPLVGDWDGDGDDDYGLRDPLSGLFTFINDDGSQATMLFGTDSDRGFVGDWNGDGIDEPGLFRPADKQFIVRYPEGPVDRITLGSVNSIPVTGDWDGDGRDDIGAFTDGIFTLRTRPKTGTPRVWSFALGDSNDLPVAGNFNRDGLEDVGVFDPDTGVWTLRRSAPMDTSEGSLLTSDYGPQRR